MDLSLHTRSSSSCLDLTISLLPSSPSPSSSSFVSASGDMRDLDINQVPAAGEGTEGWRMTTMMRTMNFGLNEDQEVDINNRFSYEGHASVGSCTGSEDWKIDRGEEGVGRRAKKLRLSEEQSSLLEDSFRLNHTLNPKQKEALALQLNLKPRQVEVWFQNRRARIKLRQTEMECEYLKRWFSSLREQNMRLQREVQELRAIKVEPPTALSPGSSRHLLPSSALTMCPRCEQIAASGTPFVTLIMGHLQTQAPSTSSNVMDYGT